MASMTFTLENDFGLFFSVTFFYNYIHANKSTQIFIDIYIQQGMKVN